MSEPTESRADDAPEVPPYDPALRAGEIAAATAVAGSLITPDGAGHPPMDPDLRAVARGDANWNEGDHPRDAEGKFGSGGGSGSKPSKLSPTEKSYVSSYSGDDFLRVNSELRSGKTDDPSVKHLDNAVSKSPIPAGKTLYRGMTKDAAKKLFASGTINKGDVISDPAFASTSKSEGEAQMRGLGGVVLKIETGSGAKGLDMAGHGRNENEDEVLLPRDAKMKVLGISAPKSVGAPIVVRVAYGDSDARADDDSPAAYPLADTVPSNTDPIGEVKPIAPHEGAAGRAAGILFLTEAGDILWLQRGNGGDFPGEWAFCGGHLEDSDADLEACARREALEETGLDYQGPLEKLYDNGQFAAYLARVPDKFPVTLCDESTGYSWSATVPQPAHPGVANTLRILRADTELSVAELMRDGVLPSPQRFHNIYLLRLRISGTGMAYRSMVDEHVYRDASIYLNPEMVARCNGLPVILEHPAKPTMEPGDFEKQVCGTIMLPFIDGEDLEGIARIYALDAIERLEDARISGTPISTSPSVAFAQCSKNVKVTLENGAQLLIEGKPALIDHLAICGLGVWDKGGPATGITLDNGDLNMATEAEEKAKADAEKATADKAKADAEVAEKEKADAAGGMKSFMDSMKSFCDSVKARFDSEDKAKADAVEKAKADSEAKAKADSETAEKAKADKAKADMETESVADSAAFADAQAQYDAVYSQLGNGAAPRPMAGEKLMPYRARMLRGLQKHSAVYKDSDLSAVARADSHAFAGVETHILSDAVKFARTPAAVADGELRPQTKRTEAGHMVTTYSGDPFNWMARHMQTPKRVRLSTRAELSRTH